MNPTITTQTAPDTVKSAKKRLVIYHGPGCVDGFTAAWAAWRKYGDGAEYVAAQYGGDPPDVSGREVLIVDFSYPRSALESMCRDAFGVVVMDHHKSAERDLAPWLTGDADAPMNLGLLFDMSRSGAGITWDELHGKPRPALVDYVEDRDLWSWKLSASREASAYISSFDFDFEQWDRLHDELAQPADFPRIASAGAAILRASDRHVASMVERAGRAVVGGFIVPFINTTSLTSEIVGKLAEDAPFACGWFQRNDGKFVYSLRSRQETGFDVSSVAKEYGGGGHPGAAGFTLDSLLEVFK
jgi:oligoribonuclease NrnB/cAMP/cGMP phosphodiesterase (DHH superfamily)